MDMKGLRKIIGIKIRELRKGCGLSQEAFAEKINLHPSFVGLLERGVKNPSLETLLKISTSFDVPLSDFLNPDISWQEEDLSIKRLTSIVKDKNPQEIDKAARMLEIFFE